MLTSRVRDGYYLLGKIYDLLLPGIPIKDEYSIPINTLYGNLVPEGIIDYVIEYYPETQPCFWGVPILHFEKSR